MPSKIPTVGEFMTRAPHSIGVEQTLEEAERRMSHFGVRHLPVLHGGEIVGILSDRDIALVEALPGTDPKTILVSDAMSADPYTVPSNAPLDGVAEEMAKNRYGTAVVATGEHLEGLFTTTDALRALARFIRKEAS